MRHRLDKGVRATAAQRTLRRRQMLIERLEPRIVLNGAPVITEFMARNDSTLQDFEDSFEDWIEIHNPTAEDLSLENWYLTDNEGIPAKWQFPAVTLAANDYLVVFASSNDLTDPAAELHTNFKLSAGGEYLALVQPDGTTIEQAFDSSNGEYPNQFSDVSFGLLSGGEETFFLNPSPGEQNGGPTSDNPALPIIISEIMYHPASELDAEEYIELFNAGAQEIDISGWGFDRGVSFIFPEGTRIGPGERLLTVADFEAFATAYPGVGVARVGPWQGTLSDRSEEIRIVDQFGNRVDRVTYADQGEWAARVRGPDDRGHQGWEWNAPHDAGGKSLELINPAMSNRQGQNWAASIPDGGTPGAANSVAEVDTAPMVLDVSHFPIVPSSSDPITVTAKIRDESVSGVSASLFYRIDRANNTDPFIELTMTDDAQGGDLAAGDGIFSARIPAQADGAIVEFYVRAEDDGGSARNWPSAQGQRANALFQIDDAFNAAYQPGDQPTFFVIMTEDERAELEDIGTGSSSEAESNAQMNATLILLDGDGVELRYRTGIRNRGSSSRVGPPNNQRVNVPHDDPISGTTALTFNSRFTHSQVLGATIFQAAGVVAEDTRAVQLRINGENLAEPGNLMNNTFAQTESLGSLFADNHFPLDPGGNLYSIRDALPEEGDLRYEGENPDEYRDTYFKKTNEEEDNWTDLIRLTDALNNSSDATFFEDVSQLADLDQWFRFFATDTMLANREGGLPTGRGDDFTMYSGINDPRFLMVPHDLDTLLGQGGINFDANRSPFAYENADGFRRLFNHPETVPLYYGQLLDLIDTIFLPEVFGAYVDQTLGDWVPAATIQEFKDNAAARADFMRRAIPTELTVSSSLPLAGPSQIPQTTDDTTVGLSGLFHSSLTRSVTVSGVVANFDARAVIWSLDNLPLNPGLNRLIVQAFDGPDGSGNEIGHTTIDIWSAAGNPTTGATFSLEAGSVWSYLDNGSDQGTAWRETTFVENAAWKSGPAELGYGDGGSGVRAGGTVIDCGSANCNDNNITNYFRRHFTISAGEAAKFTQLSIDLVRDDAAVVYINGVEALRDNFDANTVVLFDTLADDVASPNNGENDFHTFSLNPSLLQDGDNVIAVEIHQQRTGSSDVSFDLALTATEIQGGGTILAGSFPAGETTLVAEQGPYLVTGDLRVPAGSTLTIEPGTSLFFDEGVEMVVEGILIAVGTPYQRIQFTANPGAGFATDMPTTVALPDGPPKWAGIHFMDSMSNQNIVSYADVEFAQDRGTGNNHGSIGAFDSEVIIDHVAFAGNHLRYVYGSRSSYIIRDSYFPNMFGPGEAADTLNLDNISEHIKSEGAIPDGGHFIIENNFFGTNKGHNDVVDVVSRIRPDPILQVRNNVFMGAGDELLDLGGDVLIEGNLFMNVFKDDETSDRGFANAISTGDGNNATLVVVRNIFLEVDHAINLKSGDATLFENNTVVKVHDDFIDARGNPSVDSVINLYVDEPTGSPGLGAYAGGNIFLDAPRVFGNADLPAGQVSQLELVQNFLDTALANTTIGSRPGTLIDFWPNNLLGNPLVTNSLDLTVENFLDAPLARTAIDEFELGPGSQAVATGPLGQDFGALVPAGAWITGEPATMTTATDATLTVGGPGILAFRYRINGGQWNAEMPIGGGIVAGEATIRTAAIELTGLADGSYTVEVIGQDFAGNWQAESQPTTSRTWTVDTNGAPIDVVISEVLASNSGTLQVGQTAPDLIELFNRGDNFADLSGLSITDDVGRPSRFVFPEGTTIGAGEYLVLIADKLPSVAGELHIGFGLDDEGEGVFLFDGGNQIDGIEFGIQLTDMSIGRLPSGEWGLAQPTFGAANRSQPLGDPIALKINEWFTSGSYQIDGISFGDDFVELYNPENLPVAMGGLHLTDDPIAEPTKHRIADLSFIAATGWSVFTADSRKSAGADHVDFRLAHERGWLGLFDAQQNPIDLVAYGPQANNVSQGRAPDGDSTFQFFSQPTPGLDSSPPSIPAGLDLEMTSDTQIDLTWLSSTDSQSGVSLYRIFRNGEEIGTSQTTTFSDMDVLPNDIYTYRVSAVNGAGFESPLSEPIGSGVDTTPPSIPIGLTAQVTGPSVAELSWQPSADVQTGVQFYTIFRDGMPIATSAVPTFVDNSLPADVTSAYQVSASNSDDFESGASGKTFVAGFQDGVSDSGNYAGTRDTWINENSTSQTNGSNTDIEIDGEDPQETLGLIVWNLTQIPDGSVVTGGSITVNVTNESNGQAYELYAAIRGWSEGDASWNNAASGTPWQTAGARGSGDRGNTVLGRMGSNRTDVFTYLLNADGVAQVQAWLDNPPSNQGFIISDANNSNGIIFDSHEVNTPTDRPRLNITYTTPDTTSPSAPTSVAAEAIGTSRILLSWDAAIDAESGISLYQVFRDSILVGTTNSTSFLDTSREIDTPYSYQISAINTAGLEGPKSTPPLVISIETDTTPPSVPIGLAATSDGASIITLSWNPSTDLESGVSEYRVLRDGQPIATVIDTTFSDMGRTPGVTYEYAIAAVNGQSLESGLSNPPVSDTIAIDTTAPSTPTNLAATDNGISQVMLTWNAASDAESGISGYKVFRDGLEIGTISQTQFTDTARNTETPYSYQVLAINGQMLAGQKSAPPLVHEIVPTPISLSLAIRDTYLPNTPVLVRLEIHDELGEILRETWDATATLSSSDPNITMTDPVTGSPVSSVTLYNGQGSVLVDFGGGSDFDLTASVNGLEQTKQLTSLAGQSMTDVSGTLTGGSTNWGGIIHVTGDLTVPSGHTLNISPGTLILLDGDPVGATDSTMITIGGTVNSFGTAEQPVTFTAIDGQQPWGEIDVNGGLADFEFTNITRAGNSSRGGHTGTGPAIRLHGDGVFELAGGSIANIHGKIMQATSGDVVITDSLLTRAVMGPEIQSTSLQFHDNWIAEMSSFWHFNNVDDDHDGIYLHDQQAGQEIFLSGGVVAFTGDDGIDTLNSVVLVRDYIIRNIVDKGVSVFSGEVTIDHALISDADIGVNTKGSGNATPHTLIDRTTISNVRLGLVAQDKDAPDPNVEITYDVTNSIIQVSTGGTPLSTDYPGDINLFHVNTTLVDQDWNSPGSGTGNIRSANPGFVDLAGRDFHLLNDSPAIDVGRIDDPFNPGTAVFDEDGTRVDLGFYFFDQTPPASAKITDLVLGSTNWSGPFIGQLTAEGLGSDAGLAVDLNGQPQPTLATWNNIDLIRVVFSSDVAISLGDLQLTGLNIADYPSEIGFAPGGFNYNSATRTATWTLNQAISTDSLTLNIDRADVDADPIRWDVLPGDVNLNLAADRADLVDVMRAQFSSAGDGRYTTRHDLDGNGVINFIDLIHARDSEGGSLPAPSPAASPSMALDSHTFGFILPESIGIIESATPLATNYHRLKSAHVAKLSDSGILSDTAVDRIFSEKSGLRHRNHRGRTAIERLQLVRPIEQESPDG